MGVARRKPQGSREKGIGVNRRTGEKYNPILPPRASHQPALRLHGSQWGEMACVSGWPHPFKVRIRVQDSNELEKQTREEWNALGFFCTYDEAERRWLVRADRKG